MKNKNNYITYKNLIESYEISKITPKPKIVYHSKLGWVRLAFPENGDEKILLSKTIETLQKEVEPLKLSSKAAWIQITAKYKLNNK